MSGMSVATTSRSTAGGGIMPQRLLARNPVMLAAQARPQSMIERDLQLAQAIQMSLIFQALSSWPDYGFGACVEPAYAVGGDFFDLIPLSPDHLGIVVADVAGDGVPAALMMMRVASLLRLEARRGEAPAAALRRLNQHLLEHNDNGRYITMVYGVLDRHSSVFTYARAGHEYPIVLSAGGDVHLPSTGVGQPLGVLRDPLLDEQVIPLRPGATLLLYTDGITEAMDQRRRMFGIDRMVTVAQAHTHRAPQALCNAVCSAVETFRSRARDDLTVVAVQAGAHTRS